MKPFHKAASSVAFAIVTLLSPSISTQAATLTQGRGIVTSQGVEAMRIDAARQKYGVDGTGITIGVLSDSFNFLRSAAEDVSSGDLPANVNVLADYMQGSIAPQDEGRALLQLIHDIAPGANLAFHTAYANGPFYSDLEFSLASEQVMADGIRALAAAGADIIVDDIGFLSEPFFQDGIITQAINEVVGNGIAYFSSAGNNRRDSYESPFTASGIWEPSGYGEFHDFDPGEGVDIFQNITIPVSSNPFALTFQWDSPFFSASPESGGSPNDLDIFLYDSSGTNILASGIADNLGSNPLEIFSFVNDGSFGTDQFNLAITWSNGPTPELMKYVITQGSGTINEYNTNSSTIFGHKNAPGVSAVGAAHFYQTPAFGIDPPVLSSFSSAGSTPILFDTAGNRLPTPEIRQQPRIVAPDGTNTTFYGWDIPQDADTYPNLFGTSAAAPHAAAVAALILQMNPNLTPAEVYSILESTAVDMDDPYTPSFDVGFDNATGYGLIQADRALAVTPVESAESVPEPSFTLLSVVVLGAFGFAHRSTHKK